MDNKELRKKIDSLWKVMKKDMKKDIDGLLKTTSALLEKSEKFLKDTSRKGQKELEIIALTLKREKLCYDLGKLIAATPKKATYQKKRATILSQIKKLDTCVKKLKRKK